MSRQRTMEAILASEYVTIGELVRLTGVRYSTLKFYTEEGFLPFKQEECKLTRRYPREKTVKRIAFIKELRDHGKTISQIREMLNGEEHDGEN
ncbi:MAG: helix-turn-helix domain-containing protein [Ruminococcus sp.]|jgi:DNA-binding transcriptional MerR regulator